MLFAAQANGTERNETSPVITAVYPGTFDPITLGHMDIIRRISAIFPKVVVSVVMNIEKTPMFELEERLELIRSSVAELPNVEVDYSIDLLSEYVKKFEHPVVVKGLRNHVDYEYETTMAVFNKKLSPTLETFFITADQKYTYVSSTAVRQLAVYGADLSEYVPAPVVEAVAKMK